MPSGYFEAKLRPLARASSATFKPIQKDVQSIFEEYAAAEFIIFNHADVLKILQHVDLLCI